MKRGFCVGLVALLALGTSGQPLSSALPFLHLIDDFGVDRAGWPGVAFLDCDNDGDQDLYLTNGAGYENALLKNDGRGNFHDVAQQAGVAHRGQGSGVASADLDNDGDVDLYLANLNGPNILYLNRGDCTFSDATQRAHVGGDAHTNSVLLCDFNNDGFLDIYTANRRAAESAFPRAYDNRLYLNRGDGTFVERAAQLGVGVTYTPHSNGVTHVAVCFDYDADGDQDLLVAEDLAPIRLFENHLERGTLSFQDVTEVAGLNHAGHWMGLALADIDADGDLDVFVTNWGTSPLYMAPPDKRFHALYRNNGDGSFSDVAQAAGLAQGEFGWGAAFLDWDNDGDSDLYYAGNFYANLGNLFVGDNPGHLLLNAGDGTFREATAQYDLFNQDNNGRNREARAVAVGDLNGDGYFDLVVGNAARWDVNQARAIPGRPAVFINPGGPHHWLKLRLQGTKSNRSGVGARVSVEACARRQVKTVQSGSSFLAQNSLVLGFGLGACARVGRIDVHWPSGVEQTLSAVNPDQTIHITEPAPFSSIKFKAR